VNDGVAARSRLGQAGGIAQVGADGCVSVRPECGLCLVGSGGADDGVPAPRQAFGDGRADIPGCPGNEDAHRDIVA
jgi:hypothetical protein